MIRQKTIRIRTPEGIVFPLLVASPVVRFLALAIDLFCIMAATTVVSQVARLLSLINADFAGAVLMMLGVMVSLGYPIFMEWRFRGKTLGKMLLRLQVMDAQGLRLQFSQVLIRNLLRVVDVLPAFYLLGATVAAINAKGQRLGDIVANTIVVRRPQRVAPDFEQILAGKFNSFREHPHLVARLRRSISTAEAGVILQALFRRAQFADQDRITLFADLRTHVGRYVRFPAEVTDGLSDEQYIRNVVDILFR